MTSPNRHVHVFALCVLAAGVFGLCISPPTCEASTIYVRPALQDVCVEGVSCYPVSSENLQCPELSLGTLYVTIATPSFMSPWGYMTTTEITAGRQRIHWGPGLTGGLLLSDRASLDGVTFQTDLGKARYTQVHAARDFKSGKWLLAHRLEGYPVPNMKIGISEAIAVSGGFRLQCAHLIPVLPYYLIQHLLIKEDREQDRWTNALVAVDASVNLRDNILAYAEFMADDFPWALSAKGRVPYMVGGLVGITLPSVTAEYVRINNYVYSHKNPDNTYITRDGKLIGHPLGPDADGIYLILTISPQRPIGPFDRGQATLRLGYERHGEGMLGQPWHPADGICHEFLSGIIETRKILAVSACTDFPTTRVADWQHTQLELSLAAADIENAGHVLGARTRQGCVTITLRIHFAPCDDSCIRKRNS